MENCNINDVRRNISTDPRDLIDIRGTGNISISKTFEQDKAVYTVGYQEYSPPVIQINSAVYKVGINVPTFQFSGQIIPGSRDIVSRTMTPDKSLNLDLPFNWTDTHILGPTEGLWPRYDNLPLRISVTDQSGTVVNKDVGLSFRHLFYMGFSTADSLDEISIKALPNQHLLSSVLERYSNFDYNYSVLPAYIYWVFPKGGVTFTEAEEGPLPVPLKLDHPDVTITDEGIARLYRVIRTAVKTRFVNSIIKLS